MLRYLALITALAVLLAVLDAGQAHADVKLPGAACTTGSGNFNANMGILTCSGGVYITNPVIAAAGTVIGATTATTGTALDVSGAVLSRSYNASSSTAIDWSQGNEQYTTASCGSFTFTNLQDGGSYVLAVEGTASGTCSFSAPGVTFRLPSNHGATTAGTMTLYGFQRLGTYVFVTWQPGY